jgi:LPXTG-site transpeptidase (sortase) family protein
VARLSIPRIGIAGAPVYDRGLDREGFMLMAPGWSATHYVLSAPFGQGNAVVYGHDDIEGNIFGHLYDLRAGDVIRIEVGDTMQTYRVAGHRVVPPTAVDVLAPTTDARLTAARGGSLGGSGGSTPSCACLVRGARRGPRGSHFAGRRCRR